MKDNNMKDNNEDINNALDNIRNFEGARFTEESHDENTRLDNESNARILGIISLVVGIGINVLVALHSVSGSGGWFKFSFSASYLMLLIFFPFNMLFIIGVILMIICRIKYRASKFGKVVMYIYIFHIFAILALSMYGIC